jgi:GNAT superfamily N-acetyltransferase
MQDATSQIHIREMVEDDCAVIARAFAEEGSSSKTLSLYQGYLNDSRRGARVVLLAEYDSHFVGYLTILWDSAYPPFREEGTPEIVDFNVLEKYRRRQIGTALVDEAERRIAQRSPIAGIGVGLTPDYGAAQVLYVKRGYVPDGRGLMTHDRFVQYGDQVRVDDDLVLHLTKQLRLKRTR